MIIKGATIWAKNQRFGKIIEYNEVFWKKKKKAMKDWKQLLSVETRINLDIFLSRRHLLYYCEKYFAN